MAGKNEHIQNYEMEVKEILKKNHLSAASQFRACFTSLTTVREVKNAPAKELSARREASQLKAFSVEQKDLKQKHLSERVSVERFCSNCL